jgi:hypothetical protein
MRENREQLTKDIVVILVVGIIAILFVRTMVKTTENEKKNNTLFQKINTDSLTIDSLKMKITHDSLAHIDSLRVAHINYLNNQDNKNKDERDEANALIQYATDKQLDSLWAVYSPKISH